MRSRGASFDINDPVWLSPSGVAIGNKVLPKRQLFWKRAWHQRVYEHCLSLTPVGFAPASLELARARSWAPESKSGGELAAWLGIAGGSDFEIDLMADGPHLLMLGPTGSGKSELLKALLRSLLRPTNLANLRLVLIDFKGGAGLADFAEHPNTAGLLTDLASEDQEPFWAALADELARREQLFADAKVAGIDAYRAKVGPLDRILVTIDELAAVLASSRAAAALVEAIATRGRSLGFNLVATNQSLVGIPRLLLTNFRLRCALGEVDAVDLAQLSLTAASSLRKPSSAAPLTRLEGFRRALWLEPYQPPTEFWFAVGVS
jgi:S-DNA-T family DNA segregation ATPase FtsK/SpoIIIE